MNANELTDHKQSKIVWEPSHYGSEHRYFTYLGYHKATIDKDTKGLFYFGVYLNGICLGFKEKIETHRKAQEEAEQFLKQSQSSSSNQVIPPLS